MAMAAPTDSRRAAEQRGRFAETLAALWLCLKGYRVMARRYKSPVGEIDLVMKRGSVLAFVEVKSRADATSAAYAVTPQGRRRIVRAAESYLSRHPEALALTLRFDLVLMVPGRLPRHLPDAFTADR